MEYSSTTMLPVMDLSSEQLDKFEHVSKTYFLPPYDNDTSTLQSESNYNDRPPARYSTSYSGDDNDRVYYYTYNVDT